MTKHPFKSRLPNLRLIPSALAILIQGIALVTACILFGFTNLCATYLFNSDFAIPIFYLVLVHALLAVIYSIVFDMASWWRWIHLCFPLAVWSMFSWHVANQFYLVGFLVSLSLYWTTFRTQVPFYPSRPIVWEQVVKLIPQNKPLRLIDIGSGLGDMPMHIAKLRPDSHVEGIEIAPLPWLISVVRAKIRRSPVIFVMGDYNALNFEKYDVIFAYLSPAAMLNLWEKAQLEMLPGSMLISLEFDIPGVKPSLCIEPDTYGPKIYIWEISKLAN